MVSIKILGADALINHLKLLASFIESFRPALEKVANQINEEEKNVFSAQGAFEGRAKWKPLSPRYARMKAQMYPGKPILKATEEMFTQVSGRSGVYVLTDRSVELGTELIYAATQQYGRGKIPARPFLTATDKQIKKWGSIIDDYVFDVSKKAGFEVFRIER